MTNARRSGSSAQSPPLSCTSACMGKRFFFIRYPAIAHARGSGPHWPQTYQQDITQNRDAVFQVPLLASCRPVSRVCAYCVSEPRLRIERKAARATPERCRHVCAFLARLVQLDRKLLAVQTGLCRATSRRRNQFSKGRAAPRSWRMGNPTKHTKRLAL
jgi:hypothetical protein